MVERRSGYKRVGRNLRPEHKSRYVIIMDTILSEGWKRRRMEYKMYAVVNDTTEQGKWKEEDGKWGRGGE